jgi:hypothetical protein
MHSFRKVLSLFALAKPPGTGFFDLPIEIRNEIYQHYFMNCYVRYHRDYDLDKRRIIVKRDYCRGPEEHNLLVICHQIREEGMVVLIAQPTYVLFDDVDADVALYRMGSPLMSPFLRTLIASATKLIMSKPGEDMFYRAPPDYSLPRFDNLEVVEIFGFYPSLRKWLYRNRIITMGWPTRCWRIGPWETNAVPTKNRRIQLSKATKWVHDITGKDESQLQVRLRAWEYDEPRTATEWGNLFVSTPLLMGEVD